MLLYRVFPHKPSANSGSAFSAEYVPPQGSGRWDNPKLYRLIYLSRSPEAAVGESFANHSEWGYQLLWGPNNSVRRLATFSLDEGSFPVLDLDDPTALVSRNLRPSKVVQLNRPATQLIASDIWSEQKWAGIAWWSGLHSSWQSVAIWSHDQLRLERLEEIADHPAFADAGRTLRRVIHDTANRPPKLPRPRRNIDGQLPEGRRVDDRVAEAIRR